MRGDPVEGAWMYILRCRDGSYYVGTTRKSLDERLSDHNHGIYGGYTATRRPVEMVYAECFQRITDAIAAERRVKGWRREKKEALIAKRFDLLPALARTASEDDGQR
ncbi:MAG TPA: GIY-YIG nuclease family protein [Azospirillaceae bacterium]|nr:GIY-YIG nuclease family protein [Azospirillaceae bacterium]